MSTATEIRQKETVDSIFTKFVGSIKIKPLARQRMSLGNYSADRPAKGFSIKLKSVKHAEQDVETDITSAGSSKRHEYTLHITNRSGKTVNAEVWGI